MSSTPTANAPSPTSPERPDPSLANVDEGSRTSPAGSAGAIRVTLPTALKPKHCPDLIRIGRKGDGGYVVSRCAVETSRAVIGLGVLDDWSFEAELQSLAKGDVPVLCVDPTPTSRFILTRIARLAAKSIVRRERSFFEKSLDAMSFWRFFDGKSARLERRFVGDGTQGTITLPEILRQLPHREPIFLKADIEGAEFTILDSIVDNRASFSGISLEFHHVRENIERIIAFTKALSDRFSICHVHVNNYVLPTDGMIPDLVEITYCPNSSVDAARENTRAYPVPALDYPSMPPWPDARLVFAD